MVRIDTVNGNSKLDRDSDDIGGLAALPGLKAVRDQLPLAARHRPWAT
jgi:hypothetical protein